MKVLAIIIATCVIASIATDSPIICLYTLPIVESHGTSTSFVQAESVKYLEASGGRVVILKYTDNPNNLLALLNQCNGLYVPSYNEEADLTIILDATWHQNLQELYQQVLTMNTNGIIFPMWLSGSSVVGFFGAASMDVVEMPNLNTPLKFQDAF